MGKGTKVGAIIASITALLSSVAVIVFLILGLCGVFTLDSPSANKYHITFIANEQVLLDEYITKGELIPTDFTVPGKPDDKKTVNYKFIGWDTNGDNIANPIPTRAYRTFTAVALYVGVPRDFDPAHEWDAITIEE